MALPKLLRAVLRCCRQQDPQLFTVEPDETDMHRWAVNFHYAEGQGPCCLVRTRFEFPVTAAGIGEPRVSILAPRLTGPRIFDGALCYDVGTAGRWDPQRVDLENFLLALHADLQRATAAEGAAGYSEEELERGHVHVQAVHPEREQAAPSDAAGRQKKAAAMHKTSLKCLREGKALKALRFAMLAIRNDPSDVDCLLHRAFLFQGFHALRWAQADLRRAAGLQTGDAQAATQEALEGLARQQEAVQPTTFVLGAGLCGYCGAACDVPQSSGAPRLVPLEELSAVWGDVQDGDTVLLGPGVYRGFSALIVPDTVLRGLQCPSCGQRPMLAGCGTLLESYARQATVEGLDMRCARESSEDSLAPCVLVCEGEFALRDCRIRNDSYLGVVAENAGTACTLTNLQLHGGRFGCIARHGGCMALRDCALTGAEKVAVQAENEGVLHVADSTVERCAAGVSFLARGTIERCVLRGIAGYAVNCFRTPGPIRIAHCSVEHAKWGLSVEDVGAAAVVHNVVRHTANPALLVVNVREITVADNTFQFSGRPVVEVRGTRRVTLTRNLVAGGEMHGIEVRSSKDCPAVTAVIAHNKVSAVAQCGVTIGPAVNARIADNCIFDTGLAGIDVTGTGTGDASPAPASAFIARNSLAYGKVGIGCHHGQVAVYGNQLLHHATSLKVSGASIAVVRDNCCLSLGFPSASPSSSLSTSRGCVEALDGSAVWCEGNELLAARGPAVRLGAKCRAAVVRRNLLVATAAGVRADEDSSGDVVENHVVQCISAAELAATAAVGVRHNCLTNCGPAGAPSPEDAADHGAGNALHADAALRAAWVPAAWPTHCLGLSDAYLPLLARLADLPPAPAPAGDPCDAGGLPAEFRAVWERLAAVGDAGGPAAHE